MNTSQSPTLLAPSTARPTALDPLSLVVHSSGVVLVVLVVLVAAALLVWLIWLVKSIQLRRLAEHQHRLEAEADRTVSAPDLVELARHHGSAPGARVIFELARHRQDRSLEYLSAIGKRALLFEQQRASALMPTLQSIASASPFIGLFGTVWGIMDAFLRIGTEKSASLPVVAPAIGEALITTALGLVAAIPATIAYNYVDKSVADLMDEMSASVNTWTRLLVHDSHVPVSRTASKHQYPYYGSG